MTGSTLTDDEILAVLPVCEQVALKFRQIPNPDDRLDEAVQGLIHAAQSYIPGGEASFKTYAPIVVRSHILSTIRHDTVRNNHLRCLPETQHSEDPAHKMLVAREESERLREAMEQLMPNVRLALEMRFGIGDREESTCKEIGAALGMSTSYAQAVVAAGLVRLAKLMEE